MNTAGILMYQIYPPSIKALRSQATETAGEATHRSSQESKSDDAITDSKVSEGENQVMKEMCGL